MAVVPPSLPSKKAGRSYANAAEADPGGTQFGVLSARDLRSQPPALQLAAGPWLDDALGRQLTIALVTPGPARRGIFEPPNISPAGRMAIYEDERLHFEGYDEQIQRGANVGQSGNPLGALFSVAGNGRLRLAAHPLRCSKDPAEINPPASCFLLICADHVLSSSFDAECTLALADSPLWTITAASSIAPARAHVQEQ